MDADDIQLVEMLADLAEENEIASNVDDDSVLGSQYSTFSEPIKNDPEEEEIEDLNITSLDLDLSSWESIYNQKFNQRDNTIKIVDNKQNTESACDSNITEESDGDVTLVNFPQVDGVDDLYEILKYEKEITNNTNNLRNEDNMAIQCPVARCQLQPDHRDLDVYDIDEIETFETSEHNNYMADYEEDKCNCKQDSKSCVQKGILLNSNYFLHHERCNLSEKFTISNIDGATADSSDESDVDVIIDKNDVVIDKNKQEKRVCAYKNVPQNVIQITPKKRKLDLQDDESPSKRRNVAVKTPKRRYNSPGKTSRSPQLSGNYSPLNIIITSPKSSKSPVRQCAESPKRKRISTPDDPSTTPKHKIHPLRVSLLREKFLNSDLGNSSSLLYL